MKKYPNPFKGVPEHYPSLQNIEVLHEDVPKRIVRVLLPKKKKMPSKINDFINQEVNSERKDHEENGNTHLYLKYGKMAQYKSYTHRVREKGWNSFQDKNFSF